MIPRILVTGILAAALGGGLPLFAQLLSESAVPPKVVLRDTKPLGEAYMLVFEVTNPNDRPIYFDGYTPDSFSPSLTKGTIAPRRAMEVRKGGKWKAEPGGGCGVGAGRPPIAARASVTFTMPVEKGLFEAIRVGIEWSDSSERPGPTATAWGPRILIK